MHAVYEGSLGVAAFCSGQHRAAAALHLMQLLLTIDYRQTASSVGAKAAKCVALQASSFFFVARRRLSHPHPLLSLLQPTITQRGIPTQFIEEKQKAYEQEKRRISALTEKKMGALGGSRDDLDSLPKRSDSRDKDHRDDGRESSRTHDKDESRRQYDRGGNRDSMGARGSRGISNMPAWMAAESEASKSGDSNKPRPRDDRSDDRKDSRQDDDLDRQKHRDSGGGSRGSNADREVRDMDTRRSNSDRNRHDDRDRSRERDRRRDSGRRDRSRDRERERRRSRSGSRDRERRQRGSDAPSSRRDDDRVRRSRRSRSPVISSSSSDGSLSPASK